MLFVAVLNLIELLRLEQTRQPTQIVISSILVGAFIGIHLLVRHIWPDCYVTNIYWVCPFGGPNYFTNNKKRAERILDGTKFSGGQDIWHEFGRGLLPRFDEPLFFNEFLLFTM